MSIKRRMKSTPCHDDVINWKHFPRYWPFVRGIHRSPVKSPHKGQWRGALMFTLICARINGWVNNCKAGDLKRNRAHYDVIVMVIFLRLYQLSDTRVLHFYPSSIIVFVSSTFILPCSLRKIYFQADDFVYRPLWHFNEYQGIYSLRGKTSYRRSLEPARLDVTMIESLWNLIDI